MILFLLLLAGAGPLPALPEHPVTPAHPGPVSRPPQFTICLAGPASYYLLEGQRQANGERHRGRQRTAATWPATAGFGDTLVVVRPDNGRRTIVIVEDRFGKDDPGERLADFSRRAALDLDMLEAGVVQVRVTVKRATTPSAAQAAGREP